MGGAFLESELGKVNELKLSQAILDLMGSEQHAIGTYHKNKFTNKLQIIIQHLTS